MAVDASQTVRLSDLTSCGGCAADPQTSGGLLAAVEPTAVAALAAAGFVPVGHVTAGPAMVSLR